VTGLATALVLAAAVGHATWNLFAKRAGGGAAFIWLADLLSTALYAPLVVAILVAQRPHLGLLELGFMGGSAVLHLGYFLLLLSGYRAGDLSMVYPLARGTGPVLSTAAAIVIFGERPGPLALVGALLIASGVFMLTGGPRALAASGARRAVGYGLLTGAFIAAYTLWDKQGVGVILIPPVLMYYGSTVGRVALLAPYVLHRRGEAEREWRTHRREAVGVALLAPLSYILVLTALVFTPVSYIAPAREISILIGAALGTRLLAEGGTRRRMTAAGAMVLGVLALVFG
jgi:drug/metabolite transporter (DMT)-like permease